MTEPVVITTGERVTVQVTVTCGRLLQRRAADCCNGFTGGQTSRRRWILIVDTLQPKPT
jgi:hypothetical protein